MGIAIVHIYQIGFISAVTTLKENIHSLTVLSFVCVNMSPALLSALYMFLVTDIRGAAVGISPPRPTPPIYMRGICEAPVSNEFGQSDLKLLVGWLDLK